MPYGPSKAFLIIEKPSRSENWYVLENAYHNGSRRDTEYGPYNSRFEAEQKKRWLEEDYDKEKGY